MTRDALRAKAAAAVRNWTGAGPQRIADAVLDAIESDIRAEALGEAAKEAEDWARGYEGGALRCDTEDDDVGASYYRAQARGLRRYTRAIRALAARNGKGE